MRIAVAALVFIMNFPSLARAKSPPLKCEGGPPSSSKSGNLRSEACCKPDSGLGCLFHGPYRSWWPNGKKAVEGAYQNGRPDGEWTGWSSDGKKAISGTYKQGNLVAGKDVVQWEHEKDAEGHEDESGGL